MSDVTRLLKALSDGDHGAAGQLLPLVYDKLRRLAAPKLAREGSGHTLQPTALVDDDKGAELHALKGHEGAVLLPQVIPLQSLNGLHCAPAPTHTDAASGPSAPVGFQHSRRESPSNSARPARWSTCRTATG